MRDVDALSEQLWPPSSSVGAVAVARVVGAGCRLLVRSMSLLSSLLLYCATDHRGLRRYHAAPHAAGRQPGAGGPGIGSAWRRRSRTGGVVLRRHRHERSRPVRPPGDLPGGGRPRSPSRAPDGPGRGGPQRQVRPVLHREAVRPDGAAASSTRFRPEEQTRRLPPMDAVPLSIRVYDFDMLSLNDPIGTCQVDISALLNSRPGARTASPSTTRCTPSTARSPSRSS